MPASHFARDAQPWVFAVDPGNVVSGWVIYEPGEILGPGRVHACGNEMRNEHLREYMRGIDPWSCVLVVEMVQPYGQRMSAFVELFDTAVWIGRFVESWAGQHAYLPRGQIKLHLTGRTSTGDSAVRGALIDRWGGKERAIGTSKRKGPLFALKKHAWPALAVAVAYADGIRWRREEIEDGRK